MLALKIISTVFLSFSIITGTIKNAALCEATDIDERFGTVMTLYSLLWRVLVIVTIWEF